MRSLLRANGHEVWSQANIGTVELIGIVMLGLAALAGIYGIAWIRRRPVPPPEEVERARRAWLTHYGKLGGGEIVEMHENTIDYLYEVRGLTYRASQDTSSLREHLPSNYLTTIGGIGVKYDPRNPANSIVLSEKWTGLRQRSVRSS